MTRWEICFLFYKGMGITGPWQASIASNPMEAVLLQSRVFQEAMRIIAAQVRSNLGHRVHTNDYGRE